MRATDSEPRGKIFALVRLAVTHHRIVLLCAAVLLLLAAPGLLRLILRLDGNALVPSHSPAIAADANVRRVFGLRDQIVVFVETPGPGKLLDTSSLALVRDFTMAVQAYDELTYRDVMSLASEGRDRVDSFDYSPFLSPLPRTASEIASLRADIEAAPILKGTLVAADYSGAVILVGVPDGVDRRKLYRKITATSQAIDPGDDRIHIVGAPVAEILLGEHLLEDLVRILPLCVLLLAFTLWFVFRSVWGIAVVLVHVGACLVFTFGLMGWMGQPVFITTAVLPIILCTLAISSEVHILTSVQRVLRQSQRTDPDVALDALREIHLPLALTVITTAIGFASFVTSDLPPVRSFGLWATIGTLFSLVWSLIFTPALYCARGAQSFRSTSIGTRLLSSILTRVEAARSASWVHGCLIAVVAFLAVGAMRLTVQDGWISGFASDSEFRHSVDRVNRSVLGTHLLQVHLDFRSATPARGQAEPAFRDPAILRVLGLLEEQLRMQTATGGVIGPYSHVLTVQHLASGRNANHDRLEASPREVQRLWRQLEVGRGVHRRQEIVTDEMDQGLMTIFLKDANYADTARVMEFVNAFAEKWLQPLGGRVHFAGDVAVSQDMIARNVRGQLLSVGVGIVSLFTFLLIVLRGLWPALFAVLPVSAACVAVLGLMGWAGIPIGVATAMFVSITLGIGVDFPLHLLMRIKLERAAGSPDPVAKAMRIVGAPILIDSLVLSAGFGLLVFSHVPANARLGMLVAVSILVCCACTLVLPNSFGRPASAHVPHRMVTGRSSQMTQDGDA